MFRVPHLIQVFVNTRDRSFASELRRVRNRRGLSQKDVAELISLAGDSISCWEALDFDSKRHRLPTVEHVNALIEKLELDEPEVVALCKAWFIDTLMKKYNVVPDTSVAPPADYP